MRCWGEAWQGRAGPGRRASLDLPLQNRARGGSSLFAPAQECSRWPHPGKGELFLLAGTRLVPLARALPILGLV